MADSPAVPPLAWPPKSGVWVRPARARKARLVIAALVGLTLGYLAGWAFADGGAISAPRVDGVLLRALYELERCEGTLEWSERDHQEALESLEEVSAARRQALVRTSDVIAEHPWLCDPAARRLRRVPIPDPPEPLVVLGITPL